MSNDKTEYDLALVQGWVKTPVTVDAELDRLLALFLEPTPEPLTQLEKLLSPNTGKGDSK